MRSGSGVSVGASWRPLAVMGRQMRRHDPCSALIEAAGRGDVVDSPGVFPPENLFLLGQVVPEPPFRGDDQGKRLNAGWQLQGRREPCPRVVSGACLRGSPVQWGCHAAFLAACAASPDLGEVPETGWVASLNDRCPHNRARLFLALPRWG